MRGKRPKPTRMREAEGNRGKRRLNRSEPEFQRVEPTAVAPDWLSAAAKGEWLRVAPHLSRLGLLQVVDVMSLAAYCSAVAHWESSERMIAEHGSTLVLRDDKGVVKAVLPSPQVGMAVKWLDKIRQFASEFGFSPSSRGRIEGVNRAPGVAADDDIDEAELRRLVAEYEAENDGDKVQ